MLVYDVLSLMDARDGLGLGYGRIQWNQYLNERSMEALKMPKDKQEAEDIKESNLDKRIRKKCKSENTELTIKGRRDEECIMYFYCVHRILHRNYSIEQ